MITPDQIKDALEKLSPLYEEVEEYVIRSISGKLSRAVRNLEERGEGGEILEQFPGSVLNEIIQAAAFGVSANEILQAVQNAVDKSMEEVEETIRNLSGLNLSQQDEILKKTGISEEKTQMLPQLKNFVESAVMQTKGEIRNLTQTRAVGFSIKKGNRTQFLNLQDYLYHELDYALTKVSAGLESYDQAIFYAVKNMSRSGLRVQYPSGHTDRIDVAVRRATLTGVNQMTRHQNDSLAEEFGTDLFEVTAHAGARPSHQKWQGKVYTKKELEEICGLGSVEGLMGANCRHNYHPFLPGQTRAWTDEELEHIDNPPFEWEGKTYTQYEATQKQRSLESKIRVLKRQIYAFEETGNEEALAGAKFKKRRLMREYNAFSKAAGLKTRPNRMRVVREESLKPQELETLRNWFTNMLVKASRSL